jgi:hypothetical protein
MKAAIAPLGTSIKLVFEIPFMMTTTSVVSRVPVALQLTQSIADSTQDDAITTLWDRTFADAMATLNSQTPNGLLGTEYSIRGEKSWTSVFHQFDKAKEKYVNVEGRRGKWKRLCRRVADNSEATGNMVRMIPDVDYLKPAIAAFNFALDVGRVSFVVQDHFSHTCLFSLHNADVRSISRPSRLRARPETRYSQFQTTSVLPFPELRSC